MNLFEMHIRPSLCCLPSTPDRSKIKVVHSYKYLNVVINDSHTLKPHARYLVKKLKLKHGFYFQTKFDKLLFM